MNNELRNKLTASLFRQNMFLRLLQAEFKHFDNQPVSTQVKQILHRGKRNYENLFADLLATLPKSTNALLNENKVSEDKIAAIANIVEKCYLLDDDKLMELEQDFEAIKIDYSE